MGFDPGGEFTATEAEVMTKDLDCSSRIINYLTGIEYFSNLQSLSCSFNRLEKLDISANTALKYFSCVYCRLKSLDISTNTVLRELRCEMNPLKELDVTTNTAITSLSCGYNSQLTELDLSSNMALEKLSCVNNQLRNLDVSICAGLTFLHCEGNQITKLDVSNNTNLIHLDCRNNHIQDISSFVSLSNLTLLNVVYNNLDYDDWPDVQSLLNLVGDPVFVWGDYSLYQQSGCAYSPQKHFSPYENRNINTMHYFPDPNFKTYVEEYMGVDPGEEFTTAEAVAKTDYFSCVGRDIIDLSGIEYFVNLTHLNCSRNNLTALDISKNTALTKLLCFENKIEILDVTHNTALTLLDCSNNEFTELDVSHNTAMNYLNCGWSQLTELDLTNNPVLTDLRCRWSKLTSLDTSHNYDLERLDIIGNQLSELYVSSNTMLTDLRCGWNQLTGLDISNNTDLKMLDCRNNQIEQILSFVLLDNLISVNVINNNLDNSDWTDVQSLIIRLGEPVFSDSRLLSGIVYSPQNDFDPYVSVKNWMLHD